MKKILILTLIIVSCTKKEVNPFDIYIGGYELKSIQIENLFQTNKTGFATITKYSEKYQFKFEAENNGFKYSDSFSFSPTQSDNEYLIRNESNYQIKVNPKELVIVGISDSGTMTLIFEKI